MAYNNNVTPKSTMPPNLLGGETTIRLIMLHPATSLFVGAVLGAVIGFSGEGLLAGIASGILSSIAVFYFQELIKARLALQWTRASAMEIVSGFELATGLKQLFELARLLPHEHLSIYSDITNHVASEGGAIVVGAEETEYLTRLKALLNISKTSFCATLRGGEGARFSLDWFLNPSPGLSQEQKIDYLASVRDANIPKKVRLLIFAEHETASFFLQRENRKKLLNAMLDRKSGYPGEIYQVDPTALLNVMGVSRGDEENRIIWDDYAIFDDEVVLKHNGAASLTVSIKDQMAVYRRVFSLLETRTDLFKKVTQSHYGNETWEQWEKLQKAPDKSSPPPISTSAQPETAPITPVPPIADSEKKISSGAASDKQSGSSFSRSGSSEPSKGTADESNNPSCSKGNQ